MGRRAAMCGRPVSGMAWGRSVVGEASPGVQVLLGAAVMVPVALSGMLLIALAPGLWWVFTTYFWVAFPAVRLLERGAAGLSAQRKARPTQASRERELLAALGEHGRLTAAGAALYTSLTVAEAEEMLDGLAGRGHLRTQASEGALYYSLWETRELEEVRT